MGDTGWEVRRIRGRAGELHGLALPDPAVRAVWVLEVSRPAIVIGSAQGGDVVDAEAASLQGIDVVRRRSGGGAVLLAPGDALWVDAIVPRADPLWRDDVGAAFGWFGRSWAAALDSLGVDARVHEGRILDSDWSSLVCFAGLGAGEVTVDGAKLVGISQRRTRAGARFQAVVPARWDPAGLLRLLRLEPPQREAALDDLARRAVGAQVELGLDLDLLLRRLLQQLP